MTNTTHTKPPVTDGAGNGADSLRILNRTAVNSIIRERLDELGAGTYVFLPPFVLALIHEKITKQARELEESVRGLITERVLKRAFAEHTAQVAEAKKNKNRQPELFAGNREHAS